jgi:hypothetical protein
VRQRKSATPASFRFLSLVTGSRSWCPGSAALGLFDDAVVVFNIDPVDLHSSLGVRVVERRAADIVPHCAILAFKAFSAGRCMWGRETKNFVVW